MSNNVSLQDEVEINTKIGKVRVIVSTIKLDELETVLIVLSDKVRGSVIKRYATVTEATDGHKDAVDSLKAGRFEVKPREYDLVLTAYKPE